MKLLFKKNSVDFKIAEELAINIVQLKMNIPQHEYIPNLQRVGIASISVLASAHKSPRFSKVDCRSTCSTIPYSCTF